MATTPELVNVAVPVMDLDAVYALLADRARARNSGSVLTKDVSERVEVKNDAWTDEQLGKLAASNFLTIQHLAKILDVLATDPRGQQRYNRAELAEITGIVAGSVTAIFPKLSPHFRKHYGTDTWPFLGEDGASFTPARPGTWYWMTPEVAERWKTVRGL
ncbi:hypothetical protein [Microbacterium sp. PA5]|uniref:hypothetical protein n=1 Tax=Microbacterium sp. PA5 TaxID=3416654 RepID=UPI003CEC304E